MRLCAIVLVALVLAGQAAAQGGHIGLYSDNPGFSDCNLEEQVGVANNVYIVHTMAPQANTSQFSVVDYFGVGVIFTGASYSSNLHIGDIFTGVVVTYVGCKPLPYLVATLTFFPIYETSPCRALEVVADPALPSGQIEAVDCTGNTHFATGGLLCVNSPNCCLIGVPPGSCAPIAAESSTWGAMKALYR